MEPAGSETVPADHVELDFTGSGGLAETGIRELHKRLVQRDVLHADETTLQVLREPGKSAQSKSYMWLYRTGGDAEHPIVLYEYSPNRKPKNAEVFLEGFTGWAPCGRLHRLPQPGRSVSAWWAAGPTQGENLTRR